MTGKLKKCTIMYKTHSCNTHPELICLFSSNVGARKEKILNSLKRISYIIRTLILEVIAVKFSLNFTRLFFGFYLLKIQSLFYVVYIFRSKMYTIFIRNVQRFSKCKKFAMKINYSRRNKVIIKHTLL